MAPSVDDFLRRHLRHLLNILCNLLSHLRPQWQFLNIPSVLLSWLDFAIGPSYSLNSSQKLLQGEPVNKMEGTHFKYQNLTKMDENPSFYKMFNFRYLSSLSTMAIMVSSLYGDFPLTQIFIYLF